jgi:hypothetical protein
MIAIEAIGVIDAVGAVFFDDDLVLPFDVSRVGVGAAAHAPENDSRYNDAQFPRHRIASPSAIVQLDPQSIETQY